MIPRRIVPSLCAIVSLAGCGGRSMTWPAPVTGPFDVVITGGKVVDGTGAPWFYGDVGIRGDRIVRIVPTGMLARAQTAERIDATGLVVAPGFIDIQGQSDGAFLRGDGRVVSKITQGITTEILGEGGTVAPANRLTLHPAGNPSPEALERAAPFMGERGFSNWLEAMERRGTSPNVGSFLGATTVRVYAKGLAQGAATAAELDTMRSVVRHAMEGGAFGIASALIYPPGNFASTNELAEVSKAMAPYGGVYITHMRSEADHYLEAIAEAIEIGRRGGVPVEIYHLKAAGQRNWDKAPRAIAMIDSARSIGIDVQANMYPYIAGGTGLSACFPPWASADGLLFDNLADESVRARIKAEMLQTDTEWENLCQLATPDGVLVLGLNQQQNKSYAGQRLSEVAGAMGKDWTETAMDLVLSERQRVGTIYFLMAEPNVELQLQQPWMKFGTDASGLDPARADGLAHPRAYGTYPRILGKYVREQGVLRLEDAVRKMTSAVATRLSIQDRGLLREGMFADIAVFDPQTVIDRATFEDPHQLSRGVRYVLVNGVLVVRDEAPTDAKPGRAVRGPGFRP